MHNFSGLKYLMLTRLQNLIARDSYVYKLVCLHLVHVSCAFSLAFFLLFALSNSSLCVFALSHSIFILILSIPGCFLRRDRKSLDLDGQEGSQRCWGEETIVREFCRKKMAFLFFKSGFLW